MAMAQHVFTNLVRHMRRAGLCDTRYVTAEEQVSIFLRLIVYGMGNREAQERFQRSGDTISKAFHRVLELITNSSFYSTFVHLPGNEVPDLIATDPRYKPFFGAQAAADGSLEDAFVMEEDMGHYQSRKGRISQNILAGCTFNMEICYMMTGWEGSTADGRLWEEARQRNLAIPPDRYWLGDAGFPLCDTMLVPYRGKRYHLKEWAKGNQQFVCSYVLVSSSTDSQLQTKRP
jgi:hypothetical protein